MWKQEKTEAGDDNFRFKLTKNGVPLSIHAWLRQMRESKEFRDWYNHLLSEIPFKAFFWENPPFRHSNLEESYECSIINSPFLAGKTPTPDPFLNYFQNDEDVVTFHNLGKDALLIVPCPAGGQAVYPHIGTFVRNADAGQIDNFWKKTANETLKAISSKPIWLSTSGLGVFWLHVRIDQYPKYYQTADYKLTK